jgi:hypothetical protein
MVLLASREMGFALPVQPECSGRNQHHCRSPKGSLLPDLAILTETGAEAGTGSSAGTASATLSSVAGHL